ncbi:MAG: ParA family protein [Proteobacteria bacterium]|nr:ParA family protein [Pseudomonadota bacterium]
MSQTTNAPMIVYAVAAQKGGTGKTTLVTHLAVEAARTLRVGLMDMDGQGSLSRWWNRRQAATPLFFNAALPTLRQSIEGIRQEIDALFIDTPPAISETMRQVITLADFVIIPTLASQDDLEAIVPTLQMCNQLNKPHLIVLNQADRRIITRESKAAIEQMGRAAKVTLSRLNSYSASRTDGRTAPELQPNSTAAREVAALWQAVKGASQQGGFAA